MCGSESGNKRLVAVSPQPPAFNRKMKCPRRLDIVASVVLLGGGYVGLEWLTSSENASTYLRPNDEPIAKRNIAHRKTAANTVRVIDVPQQPDAPRLRKPAAPLRLQVS
jgi:hypothetical protein